MPRFINPLHLPVHASQYSKYSTLAGAVPTPPPPPRFTSPNRRWLPQTLYSAGKHHCTPGGFYPTITFDYLGSQNQGVPMRELIARSANALDSMIGGAYDPVFSQIGVQSITFCILWHGYTHVEWKQTVNVDEFEPMTRAQLGATISRNFSQFIEKVSQESYTGAPEWSVGNGRVKFDQLVLVSLSNIADNVWQANVAVDVA
ncbi:hypothetical protein AX16_002210 [Volvariella volvacea WC 439]|nr:hypothetical protein AX16_002210 [Volvariella volvacea WC 439]